MSADVPETLVPPFHLSEKDASVILALVRLARDNYSFFDVVTLDIPHEVIKADAAEVENALVHIPQGGQVQLSYGTVSTINSILVTVYGEYSRFAEFIPQALGDDVDRLELKFAELASS